MAIPLYRIRVRNNCRRIAELFYGIIVRHHPGRKIVVSVRAKRRRPRTMRSPSWYDLRVSVDGRRSGGKFESGDLRKDWSASWIEDVAGRTARHFTKLFGEPGGDVHFASTTGFGPEPVDSPWITVTINHENGDKQ